MVRLFLQLLLAGVTQISATGMPITNDDFSQRLPVSMGVYVNYHSEGWINGTREAGEPPFPPAAGAATASAWWEFTPSASGWIEVLRNGDNIACDLFTGTSLTDLQPVTITTAVSASPVFPSGGDFYRVTAGQPVMVRAMYIPGQAPYFGIFAPTAYSSFVLNAGVPFAQQGYEDNPSGDGISNLEKFVYGLDPSKKLSGDNGRERYPHLELTTDGRVDFVYSIDPAAFTYLNDRHYDWYVETSLSTDLVKWEKLYRWGKEGTYPLPWQRIDTEEDPAWPDDQMRTRFPLESRRYFRARIVIEGSPD
jgi:hypothetical protein